jgi:hypothetical protein
MSVKLYTVLMDDGKSYEMASDVNLAALFKKEDSTLDAVLKEEKVIVGVMHFKGVAGVFEGGFQNTYKAEIKRAFSREQAKFEALAEGAN